MGSRPWFRFDAERWLSAPEVLLMPWAQRGLYIELIALCWAEEGLDFGEAWPVVCPGVVRARSVAESKVVRAWSRHGPALVRHFHRQENGRWWNNRLWREYLHATREANSWEARQRKVCEVSQGDEMKNQKENQTGQNGGERKPAGPPTGPVSLRGDEDLEARKAELLRRMRSIREGQA